MCGRFPGDVGRKENVTKKRRKRKHTSTRRFAKLAGSLWRESLPIPCLASLKLLSRGPVSPAGQPRAGLRTPANQAIQRAPAAAMGVLNVNDVTTAGEEHGWREHDRLCMGVRRTGAGPSMQLFACEYCRLNAPPTYFAACASSACSPSSRMMLGTPVSRARAARTPWLSSAQYARTPTMCSERRMVAQAGVSM